MSSVTIEIPESIIALAKDLPIEKVAREAVIFELYRRNDISSGKAAELLGMSRIEFIQASGDLGIPFIRMSPAELEAEIAVAKAL